MPDANMKEVFKWINELRQRAWDNNANCYLHPAGYPMTWNTGEVEAEFKERSAVGYVNPADGSPTNTESGDAPEPVLVSSTPIQLFLLGEPPSRSTGRRTRPTRRQRTMEGHLRLRSGL